MINLSEEQNSSNQAYEEITKMTKMDKEAPIDTMCSVTAFTE